MLNLVKYFSKRKHRKKGRSTCTHAYRKLWRYWKSIIARWYGYYWAIAIRNTGKTQDAIKDFHCVLFLYSCFPWVCKCYEFRDLNTKELWPPILAPYLSSGFQKRNFSLFIIESHCLFFFLHKVYRYLQWLFAQYHLKLFPITYIGICPEYLWFCQFFRYQEKKSKWLLRKYLGEHGLDRACIEHIVEADYGCLAENVWRIVRNDEVKLAMQRAILSPIQTLKVNELVTVEIELVW